MNHLGQAIKDYRKKRGLSLQEMATLANSKSIGNISRMENGKAGCEDETAKKLFMAMGLSEEEAKMKIAVARSLDLLMALKNPGEALGEIVNKGMNQYLNDFKNELSRIHTKINGS